MSTVLRPVGPRPARVYWVRRLVVLAALLAVLLGAWGLVGALRGDAREPAGTAATEDATGTGTTDATDPAGGEQADAVTMDADADAAPATDGGLAPCAPTDLTVTLAAPVRAYAAAQTPAFTFAVTNAGAACTLDVGSGALVVTVTSGRDRIWSSADCAGEQPEHMLLLDAGAQHQETVTWDRTRSDEACTQGLPAPRPGTYQAVATFHGTQTGAAVFELR